MATEEELPFCEPTCTTCCASSPCGQTGCNTCGNCSTPCQNDINQMVPVVHVSAPQVAGAETTAVEDCDVFQQHDCLRADFVVPIEGGTVTIEVCDSSNYYVGQELYIRGAGYFIIVSMPSSTTIQLSNDGRTGNSAPGTIVVAELGDGECTPMQGVPPLPDDIVLPNINDKICADFQIPSVGSSAIACISNVQAWACVGQYIYIQDHGYFLIASIDDENHATITNEELGAPASGITWTGNSVPGTTVPQDACVTSVAPPPSALDSTITPSTVVPAFLCGSNIASSPGTTITTVGPNTSNNINLPQDPANQPLVVAPDVAPTACPITVIRQDTVSGVSIPNSGYTVPVDWSGMWQINASAQICAGVKAGAYNMVLARNDDEVLFMYGATHDVPGAGPSDVNLQLATMVHLNAGDIIKVYLRYRGATVTQETENALEPFTFSGHFVSS